MTDDNPLSTASPVPLIQLRRAEGTAAEIEAFRMTPRLEQWARSIKRDVIAVYLVAGDPRVLWCAKVLAIGVAGYALSPIDLMPDFTPVLGYLDDAVIALLDILAVVKLIPPEIMAEHRAAAAKQSGRPVS